MMFMSMEQPRGPQYSSNMKALSILARRAARGKKIPLDEFMGKLAGSGSPVRDEPQPSMDAARGWEKEDPTSQSGLSGMDSSLSKPCRSGPENDWILPC